MEPPCWCTTVEHQYGGHNNEHRNDNITRGNLFILLKIFIKQLRLLIEQSIDEKISGKLLCFYVIRKRATVWRDRNSVTDYSKAEHQKLPKLSEENFLDDM